MVADLSSLESIRSPQERETIPKALGVFLLLSTAGQYLGNSVLSLFMILTLDIQPHVMVVYWMVLGIPGWFNPVYGALSDYLSCYGRRRTPVIVFVTAINFVTWGALVFARDKWVVMCLGFLASFVSMIAGVAINGLIVESTGPQSDGSVQSLAMTLRCSASLGGGIIQVGLLAVANMSSVMGGAAVLYLGAFIAALLLHEERSYGGPREGLIASSDEHQGGGMLKPRYSMKLWLKSMWALLKNPQVIRSILFVFVYTAAPDSSVLYSSFTATKFSFEPWVLSIFNIAGLLGGVAGSSLYHRCLTHWKIRSVFCLGTLLYIGAYASNLLLVAGATTAAGIPPYLFIPFDSFIAVMFSTVSFIPVVQLASESCPEGIEAMVFELFTCSSFVGSTVSASVMASLSHGLGVTNKDWNSFWIVIIICSVCRLVSLVFVFVLPRQIERTVIGLQ